MSTAAAKVRSAALPLLDEGSLLCRANCVCFQASGSVCLREVLKFALGRVQKLADICKSAMADVQR